MTLRDEILRLCPRARKDYLDALESEQPYLAKLGITAKPRRWQHFFAQIAHESGGLTIREENLSYSAKRMTEVWPGRYPTLKAAAPYAKNPEALANHTYGGRMGNNRNGDGWRYRGRGLMQVTGRNEYRRVGKLIGEDLEGNPDLALDARIAVRAAATIFVDYGCLPLADSDNISAITKRINGGHNGLTDRKSWLRKAKDAWSQGIATDTLAVAPDKDGAQEEASEPEIAPREPPTPSVILKQSSRKYRLLDAVLKLLGITSLGAAATTVLDFLSIAGQVVGAITGFVAEHGLIILMLACLAGAGVVALVMRMQEEDLDTGRYQPSGGADVAD